MRMVQSLEPDTMKQPLGENATELTEPVCPVIGRASGRPVRVSITQILQSLEPDITRMPSGENATERTESVCCQCQDIFGAGTSAKAVVGWDSGQTLTEQSSEPDATNLLLGERATEFTGPKWSSNRQACSGDCVSVILQTDVKQLLEPKAMHEPSREKATELMTSKSLLSVMASRSTRLPLSESQILTDWSNDAVLERTRVPSSETATERTAESVDQVDNKAGCPLPTGNPANCRISRVLPQ